MDIREIAQNLRNYLKEMSDQERESLPSSAFVFPDRREWPIQDKDQAMTAIKFIYMGRGEPADYPAVKKAIAKKYPELADAAMEAEPKGKGAAKAARAAEVESKNTLYDSSLKGKSVTGNGFRTTFKKGKKGTLTGKFGNFSAGTGYQYEVETEDGKTVWVDAQGFDVEEGE